MYVRQLLPPKKPSIVFDGVAFDMHDQRQHDKQSEKDSL